MAEGDDLPVTANELKVLRVLWSQGPSTLGEVHAVLADRYEYTTVQTMLDRLVQKGQVLRDRRTRPARHKAKLTRSKAARHYLRFILDSVGSGPMPLVLELLRAQSLDRDELAEIRLLIDEASHAKEPKKHE